MNTKRLLLGIALTALGMMGVFATLTMDLPIPEDAKAVLSQTFTDNQIKILTLINPTILLVISVVIGTLLHYRVNLRVPLIESLVGMEGERPSVPEILKYGVLAGILSGVLLSLVGLIFQPLLPEAFKELGESLEPTLAARFLYGGLTEEILMRFGLMTLLVWVCSKIFRGTKPFVYWLGITLAAIVFAIGHFPVAFQAVENPGAGLLSYIIIGNTIGGVIFGWVYWKKGLESAFLAHIFAHVVMVSVEPILS